MESSVQSNSFFGGYAEVNGIRMYYEVHGEGNPLVLIHGGGSDIYVTFSKLIPELAKSRKIIALDMQAHGRTDDRTAPLSFQQDADDVVAVLQLLQINKADILGFSNGGQTAIEVGLRHSNMVNKLILCGAFYKKEAVVNDFWNYFEHAQLEHMPAYLQTAYLQVKNDPTGLQNMFNRDVERMRTFKGWTDEQIRSIKCPVLIMNGDQDVGSVEHTIEMYRNFPNAKLVILPGQHGEMIGEANPANDKSILPVISVQLINEFLGG